MFGLLMVQSLKIKEWFLNSELFWGMIYLLCAAFTYAYWVSIKGIRFVPEMLSGTAPRPYAYRVLVPEIINLVSKIFAFPELKSKMLMVLMFVCLVAFLYTMRYVFILFFKTEKIYVQLFPVFSSFLLIPFFRNWHAYIYDFPLLLLSALLIICLKKESIRWFYFVFILSCLNKETTVLFIPVFIILFWKSKSLLWLIAHGASQSLIFVFIRAFTIYLTRNNPGSMFEKHLFDHNLQLFSNPITLSTILAAALFVAFIFHDWKSKPLLLKCGVIVLIPLIAIMLFVGWVDELRDYYEAVPFLVPLFWASFVGWLESFRAAARSVSIKK